MKLDPMWVAGFVDGEGTFYIGINKQPSMSIGYQVLPEFRVVQHQRDIQLLHALKTFFGVGVVRVNHGDRYELRIRGIKHLREIIIPFFETHELMTKKKLDFIRFRQIIRLMESDIHLTKKGLIKIIDIAAKMNRAQKDGALKIKKTLEHDG